MRYAVISDIHANLPALEAVLADSRAQKCTHYACLGDVVGYGGSPHECVELVRNNATCCVKGNFDEYCSSGKPLTGFNEGAAKEITWTRSHLTEADSQWLSSLPYTATVDGFTLVHATLDGPQRWGYVFDKLAAAAGFPYQNTALCFFGHTHVPVAFIRESTASGQSVVKGGTYSKFRIESPKQYFVNPGSVGQPRDNNPKTAYAIYDKNAETIELRRLDYDIGSAQNSIRNRN